MVNGRPKHIARDDMDSFAALLPADSTIVASPGCGSPSTLLDVLAERSHDVPLTLMSGLQIDGYPFLDRVNSDTFKYRTWHVTGRLRREISSGIVEYIPSRASEVPDLISRWGTDVSIIRVSPPNRHGFHSLGPSASYPLASVRHARTVIAEIDAEVPRTNGAWIHQSRITATVDALMEMPRYRAGEPDEISRQIARHICALLPERPTLQLGIGAIPEALTGELIHADIGPLRFAGMVTDSVIGLAEAGRLDFDSVFPDAAISVAELMGGSDLMRFADDNPLVGVFESSIAHNPLILGRIPRFVSINSAIEVDLTGQVNAETVDGRQISGIGGSVDFSESAFASVGGLRIIALTSTTPDGARHRIVETLNRGAAVTVPRSIADIVVTEHGVADLRGRSLDERREALLAISQPAQSQRTPVDNKETTT